MTESTTTKIQTISTGDPPLVVPVYWEDMQIPLSWRMDKKYMDHTAYTPHIGALDIETSCNDKCAWMYLWAFAIDDYIVYGRTVDHLKQWLRRLADRLDLRTDFRLAVYIHNAKYDLSFLRKDISLESAKQKDFIARTRRQIIRCCMDIHYEIRDSAVYSEMPLEMMGKQIGMRKIEDYDYDAIRTPETAITEDDLKYVGRDVHILTTYYRLQLQQYNGEYETIGSIPLTATGRVKRKISQAFTWWTNHSQNNGIRKMIYDRQLKTTWKGKKDPTPEQQREIEHDKYTLSQLRKSFFGGYCYCSSLFSDTQIDNDNIGRAVSADLDACYAAMMLTKRYPINRWRPMPENVIPRKPAQFDDLISGKGCYKNMAMLIRVQLRGVEARVPDFGFLPSWYKYHVSETGMEKIQRSGRIGKAEEIEIVLTDVDFRQYRRWYRQKQIKIVSILWTEYGLLPMYIRDTIVMLYAEKKRAKQEIKALRAAGTATYADEIEYKHKKTMLARMYGVFVQDPIRMIYEWDADSHEVKQHGQSQPDTVQYSPVLYQWGCWVAAWARDTLLSMSARIGTKKNDQGIATWDNSILYCDTDCIRWYDHGEGKNLILYQYNARIRKIMQQLITPEVQQRIYDIFGVSVPADVLIGCGEWEIEIYKSYKQIGIKQYATIDEHNEFKCVISGLPRKQNYFDMFPDNQDKMDEFNMNLVIPAEYTFLKSTRYVDDEIETDVVDCTGVQRHIVSKCSVLLIPTDYRARDDDEILPEIADLDVDEILREYNKIGVRV